MLASWNPHATPAYVDMAADHRPWVKDEYLPPQAFPDNVSKYLRKPSDHLAATLYEWLVFLLDRQRRYLLGEPGILPFRWTSYRPSKGSGRLLPAQYDPAFMKSHAQENGRINLNAGAEAQAVCIHYQLPTLLLLTISL